MNTKNTEKIYKVELQGSEDSIKQVLDLDKAFNKVRNSKIALNKELSTSIATGDVKAIDDLNKKIATLDTQLKALNQSRTAAKKAADAQVLSEKELAAIKLTEAKVAESQAKADKERTANLIQQEKELDRQIDRETKLAAALERSNRAKQAEAGSQRDRLNQIGELRPFVQGTTPGSNATTNFRGEILSLDQAIAKFKDLSFAEQTFRRQFQQDGTLVGEYSKGILAAFKTGGLDNLIKNQGEKIKGELNKLDNEFAELKQQLSQVGVAADGSFGKLEAQLIQNRQQAIGLESQLEGVNTSLRGVGGIGKQVSDALNQNFKNVGQQIVQMGVGFIAFNGIVAGIRKVVDINFDLEDKTNELKAITGVGGADLEFLRKKALETSDATKFSAVEILDSFKLIASAKPELLGNVDALNQVKDAAVTLAQASGTDLPAAVDSLAKVLNQFGADAEASAQFVDTLAAGAKFGAAEVPNITAALLEFGTQAKSTNVSVQESVGLIELLAEKGIQGAEAGTKLRNVLLTLNAAKALDKKALDSLKEAGVNIEVLSNTALPLQQRLTELGKIANNNAALVRVFGKENFNAGQIVLQNIPRYAELAEQIQTTGIAQEQAADNTSNASVAWAKLSNQFVNFLSSKGVTVILTGTAAALSFLLGNLQLTIPLILTLIGLTNTWAGSKLRLLAAFLLEKTATGISIIQLGVSNGLTAAAATLTNIYAIATLRSATATGVAAIAYRILAATIALITSPLGIAVGLIVAFTTVLGTFSANASKASTATADLARNQEKFASAQRVSAELSEKVSKATENQVAKIRQLTRVTTDQSISESTRKKTLDELIRISPKYREALQGEAIDIGKVKAISDELIISLQKQARAKAVGDLAAEKEKKKFELESKLATLGPDVKVSDEKGVGSFLQNVASGLGLGDGTKGQQVRKLQNELAGVNDDLNGLYKLAGESKDIQEAIIATATAPTDTPPDKPATASKLSGEVKDRFKEIEALRDAQLTAEKRRVADIRVIRDLTTQEEIDHLKKLEEIEDQATASKLGKLSAKNAAEKAAASKLSLDKVELEIETNKQIQTIIDRQFEQDKKNIELRLKQQQDAAKEILDTVTAAPGATDTQKAEARIEFDKTMIKAETDFHKSMIGLEVDYKKESKANERERVNAIIEQRKQLKQDSLELLEAELSDSQRMLDKGLAAIKRTFADLRLGNAQSTLPNSQKQKNAESLDKAETRTTLSAEIEGLQRDIPLLKAQLDKGLDVQVKYDEKRTELANKFRELLQLDSKETEEQISLFDKLKSKLASSISNAAGFAKGSSGDKAVAGAIGDVISQSYQLAQQALENYFAAERDQIEQSRQRAFERIDLEKEQRLAVAQSAAEKASIEKKAAADKAAADKAAGEKLKAVKRSEAKIAFATEIANIFSTAYQLGPIAGPIIGALLGGLAIARLGLTLNRINSEKFARGGAIKAPTSTGGESVGPSHAEGGIPFNYEAEGKELFIVNKKSAQSSRRYTVSGTPKQIASAINEVGGGVSFANGAKIRRFATGGAIGATVTAPVFVPASSPAGDANEERLQRLEALIGDVGRMVYASDSKPVIQETKTVTDAQAKRVKQTSIGTL